MIQSGLKSLAKETSFRKVGRRLFAKESSLKRRDEFKTRVLK